MAKQDWSTVAIPVALKEKLEAMRAQLVEARERETLNRRIYLPDPSCEQVALHQVIGRLVRMDEQARARRNKHIAKKKKKKKKNKPGGQPC